MVFWLWIVIGVLLAPFVVAGAALAVAYLYIRWKHPDRLARLISKRDEPHRPRT